MSNTICVIEIPYDERLTLNFVKRFIEDEAEKFGVSLFMEVKKDYICIYHPEHITDYFSFVVTMWKEDGYNVINLSQTGKSKQYKKRAFTNAYKQQLTHSYISSQLGLSDSNEYLFKSTFNRFRSLGYDESELIKEDRFYNSLISIFKSTFGVS